ncbi:MAG: methyltransferase domain-containing protein [candidate division Zixibacteria bacterium]|nr:methyltransferase domain-containing protein [candidate division Zixibacteria bacterium]
MALIRPVVTENGRERDQVGERVATSDNASTVNQRPNAFYRRSSAETLEIALLSMKRSSPQRRQAIEQAFHDRKARDELNDFYVLNPLELADAFSVSQLGAISGRCLLEIGCGTGRLTRQFARAGAIVTGVDVSSAMVRKAKRSAECDGFKDIRIACGNVEALPFRNDSFDAIYGHSILHHLNISESAAELARVLRRGGVAVFVEPLGTNPALRLFRALTPSRRTPTERPLTLTQVAHVGTHFRAHSHQEFYLTALTAFFWYYVWRNDARFRRTILRMHEVDRRLFRFLPWISRYAWVSVLMCSK